MNLRSRSLATFAMFGLLIGLAPVAPVHASTAIASPGDLIRGTSFSAVYYMGLDGFRYVFPNEKTYMTWYSNNETTPATPDFSTVKMLSDADLATIQMGGNVTYHPGLKMIKINSDPKTYFVGQNGTLNWVTDEATAVALYGADWNTKIDDVPDGFFGNYTVGTSLTYPDTSASSESSTWYAASGIDLYTSRTYGGINSIGDDKELNDFTPISIENMVFQGLDSGAASTVTNIHVGETVRFTNNDSVDHAAVADDNSWGSGTLKPGESYVQRFKTEGTYTYHCYYHPEMTGSIVVLPALTM